MDFLDPQKKRAHKIRLMIGYFLASIALMLASVLLLFASFGYGINRTTGEVVQNGLVFIDAHPEQAIMYLNGQEKGGTDGRFVLEAGNYNLELKRDGYRSWKRDFTLDGGGIVRLVYPFLFPEKLDSKDITAFGSTPDVATESPDRKWIVMHSPEALSTFQILDTSKDELAVTNVTVPSTVLGTHKGVQKLEFVEWSTDNRHVLLKYTFDGGYEYIVFDRQEPQESYNVSTVFSRSYTTVAFKDKKFDQLYLHDAATGQLLSGKAEDKTTTAVLTDVISFWPYKDNTVLYATNVAAPAGKTIIKLKDGQVNYTIREVVRSDKFLLNIAEFDGDTFIASGSMADGKLYVYKNPVDALKKSSSTPLINKVLLRVDNPEYASFSANARFLSLQGGSKFAVYDFETDKQYKYDMGLPLVAGQKATWMDGHRLMLISDGKMNVFDYDGINKQTLTSANPGFIPLFDRDYNQLFTVGPTVADQAKTGLVRTDINLGEK